MNRKTTKTRWEFRNNEWVAVEAPLPLKPDFPGVWITHEGHVSRVVCISGGLVHVETPNFQNGNWVWPKRWPTYRDRITAVEMRA